MVAVSADMRADTLSPHLTSLSVDAESLIAEQ
jgi:hypothetical protein